MVNDDDKFASHAHPDRGMRAISSQETNYHIGIGNKEVHPSEEGSSDVESIGKGRSSRLSIPTSAGILFLTFEQVIRLNADGSYTHVHCANGAHHFTCKGLGELERQLPVELFLRCHHAHVINLAKFVEVIRIGGSRVRLIIGEEIEVSRRKWHSLLLAMARL